MEVGGSAAICGARLFDALTLKPCDLELARALHCAGHARHALGRGCGEGNLIGQIAGLEHDGGDVRIEPIGDATGHAVENFVVSLQRRCHRVLEFASIEIYRIAGGRIAEHWQVIQPAGAIIARALAPVRPADTHKLQPANTKIIRDSRT